MRVFRRARLVALCLTVGVLIGTTGPTAAGRGGFKRLGTDPVGDGTTGFDLTYLDVGRVAKDLEIRIGMNEQIPVYPAPDPAGVEWIFDVKGHTYLAEGYMRAGTETFTLFELNGDSFTQLDDLVGEFNEADGYVMIRVPLASIGAKRGTRISGTGEKGTEDVDWHVHGLTTTYTDLMATTKDFKVR